MSLGAGQSAASTQEKNGYTKIKLWLLLGAYFFVIATYTLVKVLKDSMFVSIVGKEYIPWAKLVTLFALVPAVLFYSFLVDKLRRYQLLCSYSLFYGLALALCMLLAAHPTIGLVNTVASPNRLFGWLFYVLLEGYSPFMVGVFWAFVNSVSDPDIAQKSYSFLVAGSKVGGMLGAVFGMMPFVIPAYFNMQLSDVASHQFLLCASAFFVLLVPFIIWHLMKVVPGRYMHGYEAAYQFEKERGKEEEVRPGVVDGLKMFMQYPYTLGIFGMLFFYETIHTILSYQRLGIAKDTSNSISEMSIFLYKQDFLMHFFGFFISMLGTRTLLNKFGERVCLMLVPISGGLVLMYFMVFYSPIALLWTSIFFRSINFAFAQPLREALYIPTVKEIKFKSKSWIDAFGSKFSKGTGSMINVAMQSISSSFFFAAHVGLFAVLTVVWSIVAFFMGRRFVKAIANNEVIGSKEEKEATV